MTNLKSDVVLSPFHEGFSGYDVTLVQHSEHLTQDPPGMLQSKIANFKNEKLNSVQMKMNRIL